MNRRVALSLAVLGLLLAAAAVPASAQGTFKVPFRFQAGDQKLPAGDYWVGKGGEKELIFRHVSSGKEFKVAVLDALTPPNPAPTEPRLVIDMVGNFEPSYTEYVTDYVLAEVWLAGDSGFLIHTTKGAHTSQTIKGQKADK